MKKYKEQKQKVSFWMPTSKLEILMKEYKTDSITELFNILVDDKLDNNFKPKDDTRSVITSIGGKNKLAKRIIEHMPEHSIYIEPFGNTASILLQKAPVKKEVFNDINEDVVNFFNILQADPIALYNACIKIPYSEVVYKEMVSTPIPTDPLQKAVRFFYLNRAGFLSSSNSKTGFRTNASDGRDFGQFYYRECERFYAISKRLQGVELLNRDFRKVIKAYSSNPDALILADPPYYDGTDYYESKFKLKDHSELARLLSNIKGKAIVLHSKNYQIHKLYTGLGFKFSTIRTKYAPRMVLVDNEGTKTRPESLLYLYMNF
ncbi:MAG TPA: DNA adenine methylase [Bacillus sp. (in: firmicutes)]|nr:DNA adenine methylase [Bacillus sp. (in: firmicutes)]